MSTPLRTDSPIEEALADAIVPRLRPDVVIGTQKQFRTSEKWMRVDFYLTVDNRSLVIECDGREFHDYDADRHRDHLIMTECGVSEIFRFKGTDIHFYAKGCVDEIERMLPYYFREAAPLSREDKKLLILTWWKSLTIQPIYRCADGGSVSEFKPPDWQEKAKGERIWNLGDFIGADIQAIVPPQRGGPRQ